MWFNPFAGTGDEYARKVVVYDAAGTITLPGTGYVYGNGSSPATFSTTIPVTNIVAGTNLQILMNVAGTNQWGTFNYSTMGTGTLGVGFGGIGRSSLGTGSIIIGTNSSATNELLAVASGNVLISNGTNTNPSYGKVGLTTHVSGALPIANAGTNITTYTTGDFLYSSATDVLAKRPIGSTGQYLKVVGGLPTWASFVTGDIPLTSTQIGVGNVSNVLSGSSAFTFGSSLLNVTGRGIFSDTLRSIVGLKSNALFLYNRKDATNDDMYQWDLLDNGAGAGQSLRLSYNSTRTAGGSASPFLLTITDAKVGIATGPAMTKTLETGGTFGAIGLANFTVGAVFGSTSGASKATNGGIDIYSGGNTLSLGADDAASTRTVNTVKSATVSSITYANGATPFTVVNARSAASNHFVYLGGGNTGQYAANEIGLFTAGTNTTLEGTDRFHILSDGKIGISNVNPTYQLDMSKTGDAVVRLSTTATSSTLSAISFSWNGNTNNTGAIGVLSGENKMRFMVASNVPPTVSNFNSFTKMTIDGATGYLGIGTSSPTHVLQAVYADTLTYSSTSLNGNGLFIYNNNTKNLPNTFTGIRLQVSSNGTQNSVAWIRAIQSQASSSNTTLLSFDLRNNAGTLGQKMSINGETGNVMIGTGTPNSKLDVAGDITLSGANANNIVLKASSDLVSTLRWDISGLTTASSNFQVGRLTSGGNLSFSILKGDNTANIQTNFTGFSNSYINALAGNVSIGFVGTPLSKLHVYTGGLSGATPIIDAEANGTGGRPYLRFRAESANYGFIGYGGAAEIMTVMNYQNSSLQLGPNNAVYMTILANGNVGIGNTNPGQKLTVSDNIAWGSNSEGILTYTANTNAIVRAATSRDLKLQSNGGLSEITLLSNGNVGIGNATPLKNLVVQGLNGAAGTSGTTQDGIFRLQPTGTTLAIDIGANSTGTYGWFQARANTDFSINYNLALNPNGGNVGIGTISPNAPLQFANATANRKIVINELANNDHQFYGFGINASILRYQVAATTTDHVFYAGTGVSNSNELMRVKGTGDVGIGTSSPIAALDVSDGNISALLGAQDGLKTRTINTVKRARLGAYTYGNLSTPLTLIYANSTSLVNVVNLGGGSPGMVAADQVLIFTGVANNTVGGTERMRVDELGNVGIGAGANALAILDVSSTTKGVRFSPMTTAQRTAITATEGLEVYDTDLDKKYVNNGATWEQVSSYKSVTTHVYDAPSLANGAEQQTTVTVSSAALGDVVFVSVPLDWQGLDIWAYVSATNTVTIRFRNGTGGAIDLASATYTLRRQ